MEIWKFFPDANSKPTYKMYVENKDILKSILKLSGVKSSATYSDGYFRIIGWDVIVPANRLKAIYKLTGLKKQKIKMV